MTEKCSQQSKLAGGLIRCELVVEQGLTRLAGPGMYHYPCDKCLAANNGQPPGKFEDSPPLVQIVAFNDRMKSRQTVMPPQRTVASPPSIAKQAASLAGALWRWAGSGFSITPEEVYKRRLAICESCEHFSNHRCKLCGCALKAKLRMPTENCPANPPKWLALERDGAGNETMSAHLTTVKS